MSIILAIETSTETASVALLRGDEAVVRRSNGVGTHSQGLLPMVQQVLADAGITISQCDALAFGAGPGSFTGVRTACGAAQGLAFGAALPVVPVVTLLAMAHRCRVLAGVDEVMPMLDARMGEIYWAQYRFDGEWRVVAPPALSGCTGVAIKGNPVACGNGLAVCGTTSAGWAAQFPDVMPDAIDIAHLARADVAAGRMVDPRDAQPLYLRNKVALTTAERTARSAA